MHPIIFYSTHFTIYTLWIFIGLAIIAGTYSTIKLAKLNNLKIQFINDNSLFLVLISILGARVYFLIQNFQSYFYEISSQTLLNTLFIWDKGLSLTGAIISFTIAFYILCKKNEQNFLKWLDVIIPSFILAMAIYAMGSFFEGNNYGKETGLPWGVNFESPNIKYRVPIHPTQIYAFIYSVAIYTFLVIYNQTIKIKETERRGFIATIGILSFSFFKFIEEFFRGDDTWLFFGIRLPQIFAGITILVSGIFLIKKYTQFIDKK